MNGNLFPEAGQKGVDSALGVQTPEGIEYILYPAGLLIRSCAWVVDSLIQGVVLFALLVTVGLLDRILGIWFFFLVVFALDWFYHMFFDLFSGGQSPGKRLLGIRVVSGDGSPINPGASFLRNLLRFADTFMFLYLIAFICMLVSPAFRRIGDWAADTLVVYTSGARIPSRFTSPTLRRPDMPWLNKILPISPPGDLGYEEKQALLMFARRYPLLGKARADEIASVWAERLKRGGAAPEAAFREDDFSPSAYLLGIARSLGGAGGGVPVQTRRFPR